jgi:hypothetical protein
MSGAVFSHRTISSLTKDVGRYCIVNGLFYLVLAEEAALKNFQNAKLAGISAVSALRIYNEQ